MFNTCTGVIGKDKPTYYAGSRLFRLVRYAELAQKRARFDYSRMMTMDKLTKVVHYQQPIKASVANVTQL